MARIAHLSVILAVAVAATGVAERADALSCVSPTVEGSFAAADAAEARYVLAVGRVVPDPGQSVPAPTNAQPREGATISARLTGRTLTATGFDAPVETPLSVTLDCVGSWCATLPVQEALYFIEQREDGLHLTEGPCPRNVLAVREGTEARILQCALEGCEAPG